MNLVLVGHGSIGSKYKECILKRLSDDDELYIVDNNHNLIKELKSKGLNCFESINELKGKDITHGIVANWGPEHIKTANELINLGCKRLIIEKPISARKDELDLFKKRVLEENIFVTVHHHWGYTNIEKVLNNAELEFNLGKPVGIRMIGGAICLSTNGTHVFDLGCAILNSQPLTISAELELDYINPRSKNLVNIGGMASYKMKNDSFIHVSISNSNSEAMRLEIIYRNGIIKLNTDTKLMCFKRREEEIIKFGDKITRYGDMEFIDEIKYKDLSTVDIVLEDLISGTKPKVPIKRAELSILMVLGALQSHLSGERVQFDSIKDSGILIS